jgi:hypothetical protein
MRLEKVITNKQNFFLSFLGFLKVSDEKSRIGIRNLVYGSKDTDPDQYVTDPERSCREFRQQRRQNCTIKGTEIHLSATIKRTEIHLSAVLKSAPEAMR